MWSLKCAAGSPTFQRVESSGESAAGPHELSADIVHRTRLTLPIARLLFMTSDMGREYEAH